MTTNLTELSIHITGPLGITDNLALYLLWDLVVDCQFEGVQRFQHTGRKLWYLVGQAEAEKIKSALENQGWNDAIYDKRRKNKKIRASMAAMKNNGWGTFEERIAAVAKKVTRIELTPHKTD